MVKTKQQVISLDKAYLSQKNVDYKIYSFLLYISFLDEEDQIRYIPKKHPELGKLTLQKLLDYFNEKQLNPNNKISFSTFQRRFAIYKKIGLMRELELDGKPIYYLFQDFEIFQYVSTQTLTYLADTASSEVIKIYGYLLNKYLWKIKTDEKYLFSLKELTELIGYSSNNNGNTKIIRNCLRALELSGLLACSETYQLVNGIPVPKISLDRAYFSSPLIEQ